MQFGNDPVIRNDRAMPSPWAILQSGNLYVYVMNNPVYWLDPSGWFAAPARIHNWVVADVASRHGLESNHWVTSDAIRTWGVVD